MEKQLNSYSLPVKQVDYSEHFTKESLMRSVIAAREGIISTHVRVLVERAARKEAKGYSNFAKGYP